MKNKILALLTLLMMTPLFAEAKPITVQVKGMVCSFCAQGIEKKLKGVPEVAKVAVNMETKLVSIETSGESDIADEKLKSIITESGYEVVKIERSK